MRVLPKSALFAIAAACLAWTAEAVPITYQGTLSGPAEVPPNDSPGTGSTLVTIDTDAHTLRVFFEFSNLLGLTTRAHIHGPTAVPLVGAAGVITTDPTFENTPLGVTSGSYDETFDLTDIAFYNPGFLTDNGFTTAAEAEAALASALAGRQAYLNVHTDLFPGGEIRGFLTAVPVPAALPMLLAGLLALGWMGARRRTG